MNFVTTTLILRKLYGTLDSVLKLLKYIHLAIIINKRGKILSWGFNKTLISPKIRCSKCRRSIHAEISAFNNLNWSAKKNDITTIISLRINSSYTITCGKTCLSCIKFLNKIKRLINLRDVIYSTKQGLIVKRRVDLLMNECKYSSCHKHN